MKLTFLVFIEMFKQVGAGLNTSQKKQTSIFTRKRKSLWDHGLNILDLRQTNRLLIQQTSGHCKSLCEYVAHIGSCMGKTEGYTASIICHRLFSLPSEWTIFVIFRVRLPMNLLYKKLSLAVSCYSAP